MPPRWLALLLRLYPEDFRAARSAEVADFVACELEAAGRRRILVTARIALDLARGAWRLRRRGSGTRGKGTPGRGDGGMGTMLQDVRLAARSLRRSPGFTVAVIVTLALGAGLNTGIFSVVNGVLLRPLGYRDEAHLVYLRARQEAKGLDDVLVSGGNWRQLRQAMPALSDLEAVATIRQNLTGAVLPRQVEVGWTSPGLLGMLGASPELGRLYGAADPPGTAVLSHALWEEAFGGDPSVVGRTVRLDGHAYAVVGVLPATFRLELPTRGATEPPVEIWKNPDRLWQNGDVWNAQGPSLGVLRMVGRLRADASLAEAQAQADAAVAALRARDSRYESLGFGVRVQALHAQVVEAVRPTLLLLMGAVVFVLLIACANVANLLLVRAQGRRRELAVRVALGSPRRRLARLLLLESLLLALAGTGLGLALASAFVHLVPVMAPPELPHVDGIGMDGRVVAYALAVSLLITLLVGVAPAVKALGTDPAVELGNARGTGARRWRLRDGLVVIQVALSLILLTGAGLLVATVTRLQGVEPGFDSRDLFSFGVSIPGTKYGWPEEAGRFYRDVQRNVADLPGVGAAGVVWPLPLTGSWSGDVEAVDAERASVGTIPYYLATEEYFDAARIPLVDGRLFHAGDGKGVAVISESVARRAFPGRSAVGRTIRANPWGPGLRDFEVIGVVGDVRARALGEPTRGGVYFDVRWWSWVDWEVHVVARTSLPATTFVPTLRKTIAAMDPDVPVAHPQFVQALVAAQTAPARFVLALLGLFALSAGALAVVGLYAVVSYTVGSQRREIGIRMALGSRRSGIERMVVLRGFTLAALGVLLGAVGALFAGGLLRSLLYGVRPDDPATLILAAGVMTAAAVVASWLPARRAARADPVEVLKTE